MIDITTVGAYGLGIASALLVVALITGAREGWRVFWARRWRISRERHEAELIELAVAIDAVVDDLAELDRKVHYRHNIHCPECGWFARQAEGFPPGVSDCQTHGIQLRTLPHTGSIPVIIYSVPPLADPEPLEIAQAEVLPEIVVDFDDLGLPALPAIEALVTNKEEAVLSR